ncbi:transposase [Corallococcus terminator]
MQRVDPDKLVVVNETGSRTDRTRTHGRAPAGERLTGEAVPRNRGCVTTVLGALSLQGIEAHMEVEGGTSLEVWGRFVRGARVVFLPPYSPDFSPIELAWSKFKALLRKWRLRTRSGLRQGIKLALAAISPGDTLGWSTHCGYSVAQPN